MDYQKFEKVVGEIPDFIKGVALYGYGESYLHKDIFKMTKALNHKVTSISTNCVFFHKEEHLVRILESGLDELTVCLDGATEETYAEYRTGSRRSFAAVKQGIARLMEMKKEMGLGKPVISLQFIIMKHNMHEVDRIKAIADEVGVDKLLLKKTTYQQESLGEHKRKYDIVYESFVGTWASALATCSSPFICWDGTVAPCCVDYNAAFPLGNAFETPFEEILRSDRRIEFLKKVLKGENEYCTKKNCRLYKGIKGKLSESGGCE